MADVAEPKIEENPDEKRPEARPVEDSASDASPRETRRSGGYRVRFAPSPTGFLHIGGVRTSLFNWLVARKHGGAFILRIEDTDKERSKPEFEEDIIAGHRAVGIEWDELYRQSERTEIYREHLERLLNEEKAYYCFCSKEELEAERQGMLAQGLAPIYSGRCRRLPQDEVRERIERGDEAVIRLKIPEKKIAFKDIIKGPVEFDARLFGDTVIARSAREPLYNFAVTVDDALMSISHVIRGEEHLSNTPKQIALAEALGFDLPVFAHLPLILTRERRKLSKRDGEVGLRDYLARGYLPEAIVNFVAFLGWHPRDEKEILSLNELVEEFDLARVQKAGAVFNIEKLNSLNRHYINRVIPVERLIERAQTFLPEGWKLTEPMLESVRSRVTVLADLPELVEFYFVEPDYPAERLHWQGRGESTEANLERIKNALLGADETDFTVPALTERMGAVMDAERRGEYLWPLRVALSGREASPGPYEIMAALGKTETIRRINVALTKLGTLL